jgi:hypothetical protein
VAVLAKRADVDESLVVAEADLCAFYDRTLAEQRRAELRAMYVIGGRVRAHGQLAFDRLRQSLLRCGQNVGKNRTTLLRYAFVHQRIGPSEFEELIRKGDARGYPVTFWDLIAVAKLSRVDRRARVEALLRRRPLSSPAPPAG